MPLPHQWPQASESPAGFSRTLEAFWSCRLRRCTGSVAWLRPGQHCQCAGGWLTSGHFERVLKAPEVPWSSTSEPVRPLQPASPTCGPWAAAGRAHLAQSQYPQDAAMQGVRAIVTQALRMWSLGKLWDWRVLWGLRARSPLERGEQRHLPRYDSHESFGAFWCRPATTLAPSAGKRLHESL